MAKRKRADRWPELCARVAVDDGLPYRDVGTWTEEKLFTWNRYIEITTKAMADNPKWTGGMVYVDLFAGPGVCRIRESNNRRIPGSALLAAWAPKQFRQVLACEKDPILADALEKRLSSANAAVKATVVTGDCNEVIVELVKMIPQGALTLAFVDPEGLHVHFQTLRMLASNRPVDLAILFADRMDVVRNVALYASQADSNLDRFLGPNSNWREEWQGLSNQDAEHTCQLFGDIFRSQLETQLGYKYFDDRMYRSSRSALYRIIFAAKHELARKLWNEISKIDRGGQLELPF